MRSFRLPILLMMILAMLAATGCRKKVKTAKPPRLGATESGIASWYGHPYHGRRAANGEVYDMEKLTAAHRTLPFETWVRVKNLSNDKTVDVRIQDRGPFVDGRIIDLSRAAAREIEMLGPGIVKVRLTVIAPPKSIEKQTIAKQTAKQTIEKQPEAFAVQVGAFRDKRRAEEMRRDMQERFGSARLVLRSGNPQVWRVLVGEELEQSGADALAERIHASGTTAFVVRLDVAEVGESAP